METNETSVTLRSQNNGAPVRRHHHRHNVKNRYEFIKTLGKGTYGKVKLARHKETNQLVAVKAIRKDRVKDSVDMRHIRREMEIMSSIKHPHIIQIYEVFENQDKIVIVMEYAAGGELYDYLAARKGVSDSQAKKFFGQIVSAVRYCHKRGIVHRDLKLENILLDDHRQIKIADFGLANYFKTDSLLSTYCGSPLYASPEIVCGIPYKGPEVDSWSLGVLLYTLVYGTMPFDGRSFPVLTKQITTGDFCIPTKLSDAHGLISAMLTVDPKHRATVDDVADHCWVDLTTEPVTSDSPDLSDYSDYLNGILENDNDAGDLDGTLKANSNDDAAQLKSILKNTETRQSDTSEQDENSTGHLAAVCGLHAKDSLKLKTKPHRASAKRRVLRTRRDRESGYYSSPERVPIIRETAAPSDPVSSSVPQIKSSLVAGNRLARLNLKPSAPSKMPNQVSKDCYLVPINPGPDERLASLSSDDGCSIGSLTRPASTYSDSSILSSDSFDLCLFEGPLQNDQERPRVSLKSRPHSLPVASSDDVVAERAQGSLTPKSEKLVRDIQRILVPGGRRTKRHSNGESPARPHSLESPQLSSMVSQLSVDLDLAYKKAIDVYSNLRSAEV